MIVTTLTGREFSQNVNEAKHAASGGPVFITQRGQPTHVLLTIDDYRRLVGGHMSVAEALADHNADFDFKPPTIGPGVVNPADLD